MKIYLQATCGLANRMQCIDAGVTLARHLDCEVAVIWMENDALNAPFNDIFRPVAGLDVMSERPWQVLGELLKDTERTFSFANKDLGSLPTRMNFWANYDFGTYENIVFRTHKRFCYEKRGESCLSPSDEVQEQIDLFSKQVGACIGVHVRRTDHTTAIEHSPLEAFEEYMDGLPEERFFLCSDDPTVVDAFTRRYPGRILTAGHTNLRRDTSDGIKAALVDMMLLSKTRYILGSFGSTFSGTAGYLGRIPVEAARLRR